MHLITGIDCPFYFLVLEFPQNPAKELLDGVGEGLWACVSALADSFVGELKKAHPFPLAVQSLPEIQVKLSSQEESIRGAALVTGRRRDEGCCVSWATLWAGLILNLLPTSFTSPLIQTLVFSSM